MAIGYSAPVADGHPASSPGGSLATRPVRDAQALTCTSITSEREFRELESAWRELFAVSASPSPFHTWDFVVEWWRTFVLGQFGCATGDWEVVVVRDGSRRVVAILPFFLEHNQGVPLLGVTLQPFGRSTSTDTMTDEPVAIHRSGFESAATAAAKRYLLARRGDRPWDVAALRWSGQKATSIPSRTAFETWPCVEVERAAAAPLVVRPQGSWDSYRAMLSKSTRDNLSYYPKRLTRDMGSWSLRVARSPLEIDAAAQILVELHRRRSRSSKGVQHFDHLATPQQVSFLRAWFQRAARRGEAQIHLLEVGSSVVAAQAYVGAPGCLAVYYSGFEERFHRYSPLTIITAEVMIAAFNNRLGRVEFPPGPQSWKTRWLAREQRSIRETSLYAVGPDALMRGMARRAFWYFKTR
jgi:CelD/BcsL family acetyltransferase involved in cellulose biosynthesis